MNVKKILNEFLYISKFALAGTVSVIADMTVYYFLILHSVYPELAQPISLTIGLLLSFMINRFFTFKSAERVMGIVLVRYIIVCVFCILISPYVIMFSSYIMDEVWGKIPATFFIGVINYFFNRVWVYRSFRRRSDKNEPDSIK